PEQSAPWIEVTGRAGSHRLHYTEDTSVRTVADGTSTELTHPRTDLLENLIDHVRNREIPLISPLSSTGAFSAVLEAIQSAPDPTPITAAAVTWHGEGEAAHPVVEDIERTLIRAVETGRPFSEIGVPWASADAVHTW